MGISLEFRRVLFRSGCGNRNEVPVRNSSANGFRVPPGVLGSARASTSWNGTSSSLSTAENVSFTWPEKCSSVSSSMHLPRPVQVRHGTGAIRARHCLFGRTDSIERSEEHTSELQSLMRISYAVFCLKKKNNTQRLQTNLT